MSEVIYQSKDSVATLTLNRPDARNAYSEIMVKSLIEGIDRAENDPEVRVIIITGAGKAFSAGGDLKRMVADEGMFSGKEPGELRRSYVLGIQRIPERIARVDKPIIAAINGSAIGAGLDLACMCDFRIASKTAKLGSTFVKLGLVPGDGGAYFLPRIIGFPKALELILTGRIVDAEEALQIDLVNQVVEPEALMPATLKLAQVLSANAPLAVQLSKRAAYRSWETDLTNALELAATYQGMAQRTDDHREGVQALLERRQPIFKGK